MALHRRMHILHLSLVMVVVVTILLGTPTPTTARSLLPTQLALPDCPDHCGNLTIPYPFGIGDGCYLDRRFEITCNISTQPPTAFFMRGNVEITSISLYDGEVQIQQFAASDCYDADGNWTETNSPVLSVPPPYSFSETKNVFVAVGCDTYAFFKGYRGEEEYKTGCMSQCDNLDNAIDQRDTCSGVGCCQTKIPSGLKNRTVTLGSFDNYIYVRDSHRCSYAFLVQEGEFNFNSTSFRELNYTTQLPAIIDWVIGNESCDIAAKNESTFACKANSYCHNRSSGGYICRCRSGYEGNPYLPGGCQDIDECKAPDYCGNGTCINSARGHSCLCPKGYKYVDLDKKSCIKDNGRAKLSILLIISLGLGAGVGLLLLLISAWWIHKVLKKRKNIKRKQIFFKRNGGLVLEQQLSSGEVNVEKIKLFKSKELEKSTDNFNVDRILGHGGQGTVYKGMLADGKLVAVKKSTIIDESQLSAFINEVVILSQINHRHVVQLLGCCLETEVPLLVYEFIPNGTLSQYIHGQSEEFPLTWKIRLRIATEIAGALFYLHASAAFPIYHRDIKSTNILLDAKYRAKVADFGTSRSVAIDQTHLTTLVHGTFGYLDPEYFQSSQFTEKSDVYSFGVVLVELLTGQKPISFSRSQEQGRSLATYFIISMQEDRLFDILDAQVVKGGSKADIAIVANLARRCLNLSGRKRPTMREVTAELDGVQMAGKATSHGGKNYEEVEYVRTESVEPWDVISSSTDTGPAVDGGAASSQMHEIPLLPFKSW
ncbi:wall-associated receptor kinase-like 8 [Pyrus x bretschneideri]|uniref:wall-associated receptor kinase-like 8 n=1 Tax=Pyrus x bretschneideri TaxID=225117 RepID=UPI00203002CB|nr:wall-associated receptor kinase-like 8 [Pyrus x bretschneideri]